MSESIKPPISNLQIDIQVSRAEANSGELKDKLEEKHGVELGQLMLYAVKQGITFQDALDNVRTAGNELETLKSQINAVTRDSLQDKMIVFKAELMTDHPKVAKMLRGVREWTERLRGKEASPKVPEYLEYKEQINKLYNLQKLGVSFQLGGDAEEYKLENVETHSPDTTTWAVESASGLCTLVCVSSRKFLRIGISDLARMVENIDLQDLEKAREALENGETVPSLAFNTTVRQIRAVDPVTGRYTEEQLKININTGAPAEIVPVEARDNTTPGTKLQLNDEIYIVQGPEEGMEGFLPLVGSVRRRYVKITDLENIRIGKKLTLYYSGGFRAEKNFKVDSITPAPTPEKPATKEEITHPKPVEGADAEATAPTSEAEGEDTEATEPVTPPDATPPEPAVVGEETTSEVPAPEGEAEGEEEKAERAKLHAEIRQEIRHLQLQAQNGSLRQQIQALEELDKLSRQLKDATLPQLRQERKNKEHREKVIDILKHAEGFVVMSKSTTTAIELVKCRKTGVFIKLNKKGEKVLVPYDQIQLTDDGTRSVTFVYKKDGVEFSDIFIVPDKNRTPADPTKGESFAQKNYDRFIGAGALSNMQRGVENALKTANIDAKNLENMNLNQLKDAQIDVMKIPGVEYFTDIPEQISNHIFLHELQAKILSKEEITKQEKTRLKSLVKSTKIKLAEELWREVNTSGEFNFTFFKYQFESAFPGFTVTETADGNLEVKGDRWLNVDTEEEINALQSLIDIVPDGNTLTLSPLDFDMSTGDLDGKNRTIINPTNENNPVINLRNLRNGASIDNFTLNKSVWVYGGSSSLGEGCDVSLATVCIADSIKFSGAVIHLPGYRITLGSREVPITIQGDPNIRRSIWEKGAVNETFLTYLKSIEGVTVEETTDTKQESEAEEKLTLLKERIPDSSTITLLKEEGPVNMATYTIEYQTDGTIQLSNEDGSVQHRDLQPTVFTLDAEIQVNLKGSTYEVGQIILPTAEVETRKKRFPVGTKVSMRGTDGMTHTIKITGHEEGFMRVILGDNTNTTFLSYSDITNRTITLRQNGKNKILTKEFVTYEIKIIEIPELREFELKGQTYKVEPSLMPKLEALKQVVEAGESEPYLQFDTEGKLIRFYINTPEGVAQAVFDLLSAANIDTTGLDKDNTTALSIEDTEVVKIIFNKNVTTLPNGTYLSSIRDIDAEGVTELPDKITDRLGEIEALYTPVLTTAVPLDNASLKIFLGILEYEDGTPSVEPKELSDITVDGVQITDDNKHEYEYIGGKVQKKTQDEVHEVLDESNSPDWLSVGDDLNTGEVEIPAVRQLNSVGVPDWLDLNDLPPWLMENPVNESRPDSASGDIPTWLRDAIYELEEASTAGREELTPEAESGEYKQITTLVEEIQRMVDTIILQPSTRKQKTLANTYFRGHSSNIEDATNPASLIQILNTIKTDFANKNQHLSLDISKDKLQQLLKTITEKAQQFTQEPTPAAEQEQSMGM